MRVSVALATFNGEQYLDAQLESVASQNRLPDELVVSDDSSADATIEILEAFAATAPFEVTVLGGPRLGYGRNFGRALAATSGDLVLLADQDDVWVPEKTTRLVEFADATPAATLLVHDLELVGPDLQSSGQTMLQRLDQMGLTEEDHIKGCCMALRRQLVNLALPIPEGVAHDMFINMLATRTSARALIRDPLIRYRVHTSNTSQWAPNSLKPVTRRLMWRLRARAVRRRFQPADPQRKRLEEMVADRLGREVPSDDL